MSKKFLKRLGIYAGVLVVLAAIVLTVLWQFLTSYELSRPERAMDQFFATTNQEYWITQFSSILNPNLSEFETEEDYFDTLYEKFFKGATFSYTPSSQYTDESPKYTVRSNGTTIATVCLKEDPNGKVGFGLNSWFVEAIYAVDFMSGSEETVVVTAPSTSKVTFPGAGISVMATSEANIAYQTKLLGVQTISYDKVNQLRHVRYLKDKAHTLELMKKHATIMAPKFEMVVRMLKEELAGQDIAQWHTPKGGYFVCVAAMPGTAKRTLELCKQAGVTMTEAGATHPYGIDPQDSMIRIAPSLPPIAELEKAMQVFCTCLQLAALEKILEN